MEPEDTIDYNIRKTWYNITKLYNPNPNPYPLWEQIEGGATPYGRWVQMFGGPKFGIPRAVSRYKYKFKKSIP